MTRSEPSRFQTIHLGVRRRSRPKRLHARSDRTRLRFSTAVKRHEMVLSFDYWFDFAHVTELVTHLGAVGEERLYAVTEHAAVVRASPTETRRLAIDWDLVVDVP